MLADLAYGRTAKRQRKEGGRQTRHPKHDLIVKRVQERMDDGQTDKQASDAVYLKDKLGTSGPANLIMWKREQKRLKNRVQR